MIRQLGSLAALLLVALVVAPPLSGDAANRAPATVSMIREEHRSVTVHFGNGNQSGSFKMAQPKGVIRLYRIEVPKGARVRGTAQLPKVTVPLLITAHPNDTNSSCITSGSRTTCTSSEQACPMPKGRWQFHLHKLSGHAGPVNLTFRVGPRRS